MFVASKSCLNQCLRLNLTNTQHVFSRTLKMSDFKMLDVRRWIRFDLLFRFISGRLEAPGLEARHKRNNVCGRTLGAPPRAVSPKAWLCCIIAEAKGRREEKSAQTPTRPAPCRLARNQGQSQGPISHCPAANVRVDVVRVLIFPFVHHDGVGVSAKKKKSRSARGRAARVIDIDKTPHASTAAQDARRSTPLDSGHRHDAWVQPPGSEGVAKAARLPTERSAHMPRWRSPALRLLPQPYPRTPKVMIYLLALAVHTSNKDSKSPSSQH
jgi:hypothetical protein